MIDAWLTRWLRWQGGSPCFQICGKGRAEPAFRAIDVYATPRRDASSPWPLWRGTCITWTSQVIVVGGDFAAALLRDAAALTASPSNPVAVAAGRMRDPLRRLNAGAASRASPAEILAHECGHTWQALRLGAGYLPLVGSLTLFREGRHFWNHFENQASEEGLFGGLVGGSLAYLDAAIHSGYHEDLTSAFASLTPAASSVLPPAR
jgi:hypothetical protein